MSGVTGARPTVGAGDQRKRARSLTTIRTAEQLTDGEVAEIDALHRKWFNSYHDLNVRDWLVGRVHLVRDADSGALGGVASVTEVTVLKDGRPTTIIYTPLAILEPQYRGSNMIQRIGLRSYLRARIRRPLRPTAWLFFAASYQAYLVSVRSFARSWPRRGTVTPGWVHDVVEELVGAEAKGDYDRTSGVLALTKRDVPVGGVVTDPAGADPDVAEFARLVPDHVRGSSMPAVYVPLDGHNLRALVTRMLRRPRRVRGAAA